MSRSAFVRRFSAVCGVAPMRYLTRWRMTRAGHLLARSQDSLGEIAAHVGYASEAAFSRVFKKEVGLPPAAYRTAQNQTQGDSRPN